jgi:hypothetical protein
MFNGQVAKKMHAGSCEQTNASQTLAGMAVAEKKRRLLITAPGAVERRDSAPIFRLAGTISGTIEGTVGGRVTRDLIYT